MCASPGILIINNILRIEFWSTLTFEDPPLPPVDFVFSLSVNLRGHWQWWGARTHKGIGAETALAGDTNRRDKRCMSNLLTGTHMHIVVIDRHSSFPWPSALPLTAGFRCSGGGPSPAQSYFGSAVCVCVCVCASPGILTINTICW